MVARVCTLKKKASAKRGPRPTAFDPFRASGPHRR
jgi:hypothetical protein